MKKGKYIVGDFKFRVGRGTSGKGLFATDAIPKGSCLIEYVGEKVTKEDQEKIRSKYLFWTSKDEMINGNVPYNMARYINHSCRPNCEADGPKGRIFIIALRNIKAGEEITYSYGKEYFDEYIKPKGCKCAKCRQVSS